MFTDHLNHHLDCFQRLAEQEHLIAEIGSRLAACIRQSNKILICGNGGSAADAQHFAAELIGSGSGTYAEGALDLPSIGMRRVDVPATTLADSGAVFEALFIGHAIAVAGEADDLFDA